MICLTEKWLGRRVESRFELRNYIIVCSLEAQRFTDRGRRSGGVIVYVHSQLEPFVSILRTTILCENVLWLSLKLPSSRHFIIAYLYFPPRNSPYAIVDVYDKLQEAMDTIKTNINSDDPAFIMIGDHNARTGRLSDIISLTEGGTFTSRLDYGTEVEELLDRSSPFLSTPDLPRQGS